MKSLVTDGRGGLEIRELPIPSYHEYQALVRMESCGICLGTDTKLIHGDFKGYDQYPAVLGHEGVGRVVEVGTKVTSLKVGDRVLLPFLEGETGGVHSGWGAFSEYAVVGDAAALIHDGKGPGHPLFSEAYYAQQLIPDDIPSVDAAMIVTFREVLSACKRFGFEAGKSIVIFGAGPVGLTFTRMAKLLGMGPVVVSVNRDERIAEAQHFGADHVFNSRKTNIVAALKELFPDGVDFAVDAVGSPEIINEAMNIVTYNGKICGYGVPKETSMQLDWSKAAYNWTLQFVQWPSKLEESLCHEQVIQWIRQGDLVPSEYISDVIDFADIIEAFRTAKQRSVKKMIVRF